MELIKSPRMRFPSYTTVTILGWSFIVMVLIGVQVTLEDRRTLELARTEARVNITQDIVYRHWNTEFGGVYVPVTETTKPNPYLDVPEREITTPSGVLLTLMNPAYMTRQVHGLKEKQYGIRAHLTSLDPINPGNAADAWEREALQAFEEGVQEVSWVETIEGEKYMRLISPFVVEEGCLKCHGKQGYRVGDIRGGLSVSVPMSKYVEMSDISIASIALGYGIIWLVGFLATVLVSRDLKRRLLERDQMMMAVQEGHKEYRTMIQTTNEGFCVLDQGGHILDVNGAYCKMSGYSRGELFTKKIEELEAYRSPEEIQAHLQKIVVDGRDRFEIVQRRRNGNLFDVEISAQYLPSRDGKVFLFLRDITEQKLASKKLETLLQEKDILLAEVHHRVKNNLQVITSLLNLQAEEIDDERLVAAYNESRNRINSMALVHEQLYRSKQYARIDIGAYIDQLATTLFNSYQIEPDRIQLNIVVENIYIDLERAIPCGLILNELITNSLKYAFPGDQPGEINISFRQAGNQMRLVFCDDGVGLPANFDLENIQSLGLQLVRLLVVHDLDGSLELGTCRRTGVQFAIVFPLPNPVHSERNT